MSILFDLDGTLLDTLPDFLYAVNHVRAELELAPVPTSSIRTAVTHGMKAIVCAGFGMSAENSEVPLLCDRVLKKYTECSGSHAKPFPGISSLLETLEQREIPWGVVTNKNSELAETLLARLGLKHRAACIVGRDTTPYCKPHPEPLLHACRQINRDPTLCLYVGDAATDITAGNAAGMKTIAALFGYIEDIQFAAREWGADHAVHHADEILPWYEQWQQSLRSN